MKTLFSVVILSFICFANCFAVNSSDSTFVNDSSEHFIPIFNIGCGASYHFGDNSSLFKGTNGYLWNINIETLLDRVHIWSIELSYLKWYNHNKITNGNYSDYSYKMINGDIVSFVCKYYFPYFGTWFYPSIHAGGAPFPIFSWDIGINFDLHFYKSIFIRSCYRIISRPNWSASPNLSDQQYSPFIFNFNLIYQIQL